MGGQDLRNPHSLRVRRARHWAGYGVALGEMEGTVLLH